MAATKGKKPVPVGSSQWIQTEREHIAVFHDQEIEDFAYSTRNEFEWLNEHMAEIFSDNQLNVTEIFKTPGKLRGKTPRTARRNPLEARAPLTEIFSADRRFNPTPLRSTEQRNDTLKVQPKRIAESLAEERSGHAIKVTKQSEPSPRNATLSKEDISNVEATAEDKMDIEEAVVEPELSKEVEMEEAPLNTTENMEIEQSSDERRTTEGSFHSARENVTTKDIGQFEPNGANPTSDTLLDAGLDRANSPERQPAESDAVDAMDIEETHPINEDNRDLEASPLSSQGSTPDKPLVRKSSLTFAALPAREPLTTKRSLGTRVSRTSNLDTAKHNALNRSSYLGRYTGGKSLGTSRQAEDQDMDLDEPARPGLSREESDGDGKISKLHNKSSTQRLHERINLLGKAQPPRPTKSIPTTAISVPASYPELSTNNREHSPVKEQEINKSAVPDNAIVVEDDDEDWIKPPTQQAEQIVRPALLKSRSVDVMEKIDGKESIGGTEFGMGPHDREMAKQMSPLRAEESLRKSIHDHGLKKAISTTALVSPSRHLPAMQESEQQKAISVSNPTMSSMESNTPAGSPSRFHLEGHLSASKSKLQSIMKSARGLFTSSAGVSAQARMEALSPPPSRMRNQDFQPLGGIAEAMAEPSIKDKSLYPMLPNESQSSLPEGRRTRSSTEKEEKRKDKEAKDRQRAEVELVKARDQERRKAKDYKEKMDTAAVKALTKSTMNGATLESTSKPIRQSPRRQAKEADAEETDSKDIQNMPPPSRPESQQMAHGQKAKEARRPAKPTAKPKPAQVSIRVGTVSQMSQRIPLTTGALSSSLQDTLRPASQKQHVMNKKASNSSLQTSASTASFKSSISSNTSKPKSLIIAAQKREQAEKEAQRKDEDKRERERRRAAAQEEAQKREQKQREEMEKQKERDRLALAKEEAKKLADKQAAEKRRVEMKKAQQEQQRSAKELAHALQNEKAQHSTNGHRGDVGASKHHSRMDKLSEFPRAPANHPGQNAAKAPIKRVFDPDNDDELSRPIKPQAGQNYQAMDSKRRRTGDEESYEPVTRPTMAPPIRPSDIRKAQSTTAYNQQTYGHKTQEGLKSSMFNGNYPTAPPPAASHASSSSVLKANAAGQAYQQHQYNEQASRPAHPMDMAKYTNCKIPFAEAQNPPVQTAYKTPLSSKQAVPSTSKSSPMYTNGDNIHLDEIPTDSEEEDSEDERERKANIPEWARTPNLFQQLGDQEGLDADTVFGPVAPLNMEEMFKDKSRHHRFRSRTSSANWFGSDRLTEDDIRKDNAAREKLRQDGAWTYGL